MNKAYETALPAIKALEEFLPQYIHALEQRKKRNESVDTWLTEATACRRCRTPFVRVERPEPPDLVKHFGPLYGIACKRCNASVYPPPELYLKIRADEFLDSALALISSTSSVSARVHVVLTLLYHAVELYLKCLGAYTYYIADTAVEPPTDHGDNDDLEKPDELFLSHSLARAFERIPSSVQCRLMSLGGQRNVDIRKIVESLPVAVSLFCRYHWTFPKHEKSLDTVAYGKEELVSVLCDLGRLLRSFSADERRRFM